MKTILKWAGGKKQLLSEIDARLPEKFNKYLEPFCGGGSVFIHLNQKDCIINDINTCLINVYKIIKTNPDALIEGLKKCENTDKYFYNIRNIDRDKKEFEKLSDVEKAVRFVYLNRVCFNGLYRENSKGQFNTPFGKYKNPVICDEENIKLLNIFFNDNNITFLNKNYSDVIKLGETNDFIYLDPPYDILTNSSFTKYNKNDFTRTDQENLKKELDKANEKGVLWMLSNSDTDFIKNLYKDYNIDIVKANRSINSDGNNRGKVNEVIIRNY